MLDAYIIATNSQSSSARWMDCLSENLMNIYTPGYREKKFQFKTFLDGAMGESYVNVRGQGQATPGTADENLYMEGNGFFVLRDDAGKLVYTRLGDFKFDSEGLYRSSDGQLVQGYLLNENGEIMNGAKPIDVKDFEGKEFKGSGESIPTTNIKFWIDPVNGKYLGRYEEFEFKDDGILYGKADGGKIMVPLYKIAVTNFNNPDKLYEIKHGQYIETEESGTAYIGNAQIKGKNIEQSNVDYSMTVTWYQQAQFQLGFADSITKSKRKLLEQVMGLIGS